MVRELLDVRRADLADRQADVGPLGALLDEITTAQPDADAVRFPELLAQLLGRVDHVAQANEPVVREDQEKDDQCDRRRPRFRPVHHQPRVSLELEVEHRRQRATHLGRRGDMGGQHVVV